MRRGGDEGMRRGGAPHPLIPSSPHASVVGRTTVYKIGGSLLTLPDLGRRLQGVLSQRRDSRPLLVVGGGPTADLVREWDRVHQLGEERAHQLALGSLTLNESLLLQLLPETRSVTTRRTAEETWEAGETPVLRAQEFLNAEELDEAMRREGDEEGPSEETPHPLIASSTHPSSLIPPLPHTWDVTSDSIAAWIALRWPAEELVLLKSCPLPNDRQSDHRTIGQGEQPDRSPVPIPRPPVDPYFSRLTPYLRRLDWVNLRDEEPRLQPCCIL